MPILLDNLEQDMQQANVTLSKSYTPKFFDKKLTGKGGAAAGLLSVRNNPPAVPPAKLTELMYFQYGKPSVHHNGATTITKIPVNPLHPIAYDNIHKVKYGDVNDLTKVASIYQRYGNKKTEPIYAKLDVTSFTIEETLQTNFYTGMTKKDTVFTPAYYLTLYRIVDQSIDTCNVTNSMYDFTTASYNICIRIQTVNPVNDWNSDISQNLVRNGATVDTKAFMDYMLVYEVYDSTEIQSEIWQEHMDEVMEDFIDNIKSLSNMSQKMVLTQQVRYIMSYNIPLEKYRKIYDCINKNFQPADAAEICKQNLNLLLSNTLHNLDNNKTQLQTFTPPTPAVTLPASVQRLSKEQMAAVKSTEPLILVQAGAGTGKSTLILGRIDYLIACGIKAEDITVLSFTNAAADNITAKNPNVHSMTIARMIHEIYTTNFANHELSQLNTLLNSLEIYYPNQFNTAGTTVAMFYKRIKAMISNTVNNFTDMNNFIEEHYDEVINILDTIRQTSLELEIIICYQKIDSFVEPASIKSKFLIIDEVQDNSIFEFVYTLKYIDKHKESMFIVGDCSQTLYEFRASNPRALNILEGSGTFATYQLNINYRSNQEILDMANVLLDNIEANQYANIQLKANSRAQVTEQSFLEKVRFDYVQLPRITEFHDALPSIFARDVKPYTDQCLAKGEQVAILAFTRRDIDKIKEILRNQYPNLNPNTDIISLVPDKMYNETIFSKFICKYWKQMQFAPMANIIHMIGSEIMSKLPYLTYDDKKAAPHVQNLISKWKQSERAKVTAWYNEYMQGQITQDQFFDYIKDNMIQYEIRTNAVKQSLLSSKNQDAKQSSNINSAKFLLSTIHSAKGLEFDNVVVLYRNESQLEEDKKRMYYVAFTRAMKSEFILAYDTMVSPQIQMDYLTVLKALHAKNPAPNSPLNQTPKNKRVKI